MLRALLNRVELPQRARHAIARARALWTFRNATVGAKVLANGAVRVESAGRLTVGDSVVFVADIVPCHLVVHEGATLSIGAGSVFNYGVSIEARSEVRIGERCMFGSHVRLCDTDQAGVRPIVLGREVWVAHGAVICPGVELGDGAVVAAGSVVTQNVPPRMLAMGNPARIVSQTLAADRGQ